MGWRGLIDPPSRCTPPTGWAGSFPDGQFFLALHAHTPGRRPVDPAGALCQPAADRGSRRGTDPAGARTVGDQTAQAFALNQLGVAQQLMGDYPAAAASQQQALELCCDVGNQSGQAWAFNDLGIVQKLTGDYSRAAASQHRALALFRELGDRLGQSWAHNSLRKSWSELPGGRPSRGQQPGNEALELFRGHGHRNGEAEALNELGDLAHRTRDGRQCARLPHPSAAPSHSRSARR